MWGCTASGRPGAGSTASFPTHVGVGRQVGVLLLDVQNSPHCGGAPVGMSVLYFPTLWGAKEKAQWQTPLGLFVLSVIAAASDYSTFQPGIYLFQIMLGNFL